MKNAQIVANSINEWASPIVEGAMNHMAQQSQIGYFIGAMISPQRLISSFQEFIAVPVLMDTISKLPDPIIPGFALDIVDGMIETRVKDGALAVPFINTSLGADAFRALKTICERNFKEYGENIETGASGATSATTVATATATVIETK